MQVGKVPMNPDWMEAIDMEAAAESRRRQAERDIWRQARRAAGGPDNSYGPAKKRCHPAVPRVLELRATEAPPERPEYAVVVRMSAQQFEQVATFAEHLGVTQSNLLGHLVASEYRSLKNSMFTQAEARIDGVVSHRCSKEPRTEVALP